jgi:Chitobiase/beta-hexosaminidase C-terminal domain/NHL repeat
MRFRRSLFICLTILTLAILGTAGASFALPDTMTTVTLSTTGVTGLATSPTTTLPIPSSPTGVAVDGNNNLFVVDTANNRVLMFNAVRVLVGSIGSSTGLSGFLNTAGKTTMDTTVNDTRIKLNAPSGVAVDSAGNLYIADSGNNRVHKAIANPATLQVEFTGSVISRIITIAGNGSMGFSGDGALANVAMLNNPTGVAADALGNVYIADNGNNRIRKVTVEKVAAAVITYGTITTIAGNGSPATLTAYGIALSPAPAGDLYIADSGNNRILKMTAAAGTPAVVAGTGVAGNLGAGGLALRAQLSQPSGIATDGSYLYVADTYNNCIRMISLTTGAFTTRAGDSAAFVTAIPPITAPAPLYPAINAGSTAVPPLTPLKYPMGLTVSPTGDLYVADTQNNRIEQITRSISAISTATPAGGNYTTAQTVTLSASRAATISYQLATPNGAILIASTPYTGPIAIPPPNLPSPLPTTYVLTYNSVDFNGTGEVTNTSVYNIDTILPITSYKMSAIPYSNGIIYTSRTVNVTLTSNELGSTIYYTTTGVAPTTASASFVYTGVVSIPVAATQVTTTLKYFSVDISGNKEVVQTLNLNIAPFSMLAAPLGGVYLSDQRVTLSTNDPNAEVYYSTAATQPAMPTSYLAADVLNAGIWTLITTANNPVPITAPAPPPVGSGMQNTTLFFFARDKTTLELTPVQTQVYVIDKVAPVTTASPSGSNLKPFNAPQTVTLTSDDPVATIYYTLSVIGITPTTSSTKYTGPIPINATNTLMYFAIDLAGNRGTIKQDIYTIDSVAPITVASLASGTFASIQSVTLTCNDPKATVYYTTDGTQPTVSSAKYTGPLAITKTSTLQFFAMDLAGNPEAVKSQSYTIINLTTTASPKGGAFNAAQTVELTTNEVGATIYYTLNPTTPTPSYTAYKTPLLMTAPTTTLMYYSVDVAGVQESPKTEVYTMDTVAPTTGAACIPVPGLVPADTITLTTSDNVSLAQKIKVKYIANTTTTYSKTVSGITTPITVLPYTLTDYTTPIAYTSNTIAKFFATDEAGNTEVMKTIYCPATVTTDPVPSLYLTTFVPTSLMPTAITANTVLSVTGTVGVVPPALPTPLTINGGTPITPNADGSFAQLITPMPATLSITDALGTSLNTPLTITPFVTTVPPMNNHTLSVAVGRSNGVVGNDVKIPITIDSGYQADTVSIDILIDPAVLVAAGHTNFNSSPYPLTNPSLEISGEAAASGKIISGGVVQVPVPATGYIYVTGPTGVAAPVQILPPITSINLYRILIMTPLGTKTTTPIPDGVVAYLKFTLLNSALLNSPTSGEVPLDIYVTTSVPDLVNIPANPTILTPSYSATTLPDANGSYTSMPIGSFDGLGIFTVGLPPATQTTVPYPFTSGAVSVVSKPGNTLGVGGVEVPATLGDVLNAVYMLLYPLNHPVSGSIDLNADGVVQINEVQKVINSYIGL